MKIASYVTLGLIAFLFTILPVLAADAVADPLPTQPSHFWTLGIAAVTPLVVNGIRKLVPKIPKWALPTITPVLGMALGAGINALASANLSWVDMAQAGALAVFIREVVDQAIVKRMHPVD